MSALWKGSVNSQGFPGGQSWMQPWNNHSIISPMSKPFGPLKPKLFQLKFTSNEGETYSPVGLATYPTLLDVANPVEVADNSGSPHYVWGVTLPWTRTCWWTSHHICTLQTYKWWELLDRGLICPISGKANERTVSFGQCLMHTNNAKNTPRHGQQILQAFSCPKTYVLHHRIRKRNDTELLFLLWQGTRYVLPEETEYTNGDNLLTQMFLAGEKNKIKNNAPLSNSV